MTYLRRSLPYLAYLALALCLAQALLQPAFICTDDGLFHTSKSVALEAGLRHGLLFARWQPELAAGFGYPLFNYYAPLGAYLLVGLHQLGLIYPVALYVFFILSLWLAGSAAFWLGREWWGTAGGFVSGAAYQSAPYFAFNILFRGALAETLGLALLPLVLFTFHRALTAPRGAGRLALTRWDLAAAAALAGLLFAHNATALGAAPLIAAYAGLLALQQRSFGWLVRGGLLFAAGLALAAAFWLPALGERGLVQSDRLLVPPIFTYYTNFISLRELLALPRVEDPQLLNPSPEKGLGLLAVGLAGLGALAALRAARRSPRLAWPAAFFLAALAGYALLTLSISQPVWDRVPLIAFLQFPWRLLSAGALCAAMLAGANGLWQPRAPAAPPVWSGALTAGLVAVLALGQLGWWYPRYCQALGEVDIARTLEYERDTSTIGTTAKGEFLPVTVHRFPDDRSVAEALIAGRTPDYLAGLPADAALTVRNPYPLDYAADLTLTAPAALTFKQFYFPGWRATLDGAPLPLTPDPESGLITFTLPAGAHRLRLGFGDTPIRAAGNWISLTTLAALLAGLWLTRRAPTSPPAAPDLTPLTPRMAAGLLVLALVLSGLRPWVLDRFPNPLVHTAFNAETGTVATAQQPLHLDLAGGLRLHGYDLAPASLPADGALEASLYASVAEPVTRLYRPTFRLKDAAGRQWNDNNAALPPRWHREPPPTFVWGPGSYAQWARRLEFLPGTPPGVYSVWAEVFDLETLEIKSILDAQGNAVAPAVELGTVTVSRPARPFTLTPEHAAPARFGPVSLLGYAVSAAEVRAGDALDLTWYWRSEAPMAADLKAHLELLDAAGRPALSLDLEPANGYGTSQWQPGDEWRGQHTVVIPAGLAGGVYEWVVSVEGESGQGSLGPLSVTAPERVYAPPAGLQASGAQFAGVGALAGYRLERTGQTLTVTLAWQAAATPAVSYKVFVHFGGAARVLAQSDAVPAGNTRPTTGWLAGEYVTDTHTLSLPADLPAGAYEIRVGMYDPASAARVPASGPGAEADDRVLIAAVTLP